MLFYILLGVSGATGQIFHKNAFFQKKWNPNRVALFLRNLEFGNVFPVFAEIGHSHEHL